MSIFQHHDLSKKFLALASGIPIWRWASLVLKAVWSDARLRPITAITAVPVFWAACIYSVGYVFPDKSYIQAETFEFEPGENNLLEGDLQLISVSPIPVMSVVGYHFEIGFDGLTSKKSLFSLNESSYWVGTNPQLRFQFENPPKEIVLCLDVKNQRGAHSYQEIHMSLRRSSNPSDPSHSKMGTYSPLPESMPAEGLCKSS